MSCLGVGNGPNEAEIAQLDATRAADQDVAWLEITVDETARMDVLERLEHLVHDELDVGRLQDGRPDFDGVGKVRLHEVKGGVEVLAIGRKLDAFDRDDVLVWRQQLQVADFPIRSLCVHLIAKCLEALLQCHMLSCTVVLGLPDYAIRPLAYLLLEGVTSEDGRVNCRLIHFF